MFRLGQQTLQTYIKKNLCQNKKKILFSKKKEFPRKNIYISKTGKLRIQKKYIFFSNSFCFVERWNRTFNGILRSFWTMRGFCDTHIPTSCWIRAVFIENGEYDTIKNCIDYMTYNKYDPHVAYEMRGTSISENQ